MKIIDKFDGTEHKFLSNFFMFPIKYRGKTWRSVEHAYQAQKFASKDIQKEIQDAKTPGETKKIARKHTQHINPHWHTIKFGIMYALLHIKFKDKDLKKLLLKTGDVELIEGNHWGDTCWGVCKGIGDNWLGKLLMQVRSEIKPRKIK